MSSVFHHFLGFFSR